MSSNGRHGGRRSIQLFDIIGREDAHFPATFSFPPLMKSSIIKNGNNLSSYERELSFLVARIIIKRADLKECFWLLETEQIVLDTLCSTIGDTAFNAALEAFMINTFQTLRTF